MTDLLPGCMMPDGGEACVGYAQVVEERNLLRAKLRAAMRVVEVVRRQPFGDETPAGERQKIYRALADFDKEYPNG